MAGKLWPGLSLPCLVAQVNLLLPARQRWAWGVLGACCLYALAGTQTLAAFLALLAGSAVLWWRLMPRRRLLVLAAGGAVTVLLLLAIAAPLRSRLTHKVEELRAGQVDRLHRGMRGKTECACQRTNARNHEGVSAGPSEICKLFENPFDLAAALSSTPSSIAAPQPSSSRDASR